MTTTGGTPSPPTVSGPPDWTPTPALGRAVVLTLVLLVAAVVTGRADLAVLATPFGIGTAVALRYRPRRPPQPALATRQAHVVEGNELGIDIGIGNDDESAYDLVVIRREVTAWLADHDAGRPLAVTVGGERRAKVTVRGEVARWGRHTFAPVQVQAVSGDGLLVSRSTTSPALALKVFPRTDPFDADDAMPNAAGLVGAHRSRRYGDGGELAGIRRFAPGDRLRRIDWRASLRTRELHVAQTLSDRDAELVLVLDVLHEAGGSSAGASGQRSTGGAMNAGVDGTASVIDTTVRAAAGIAQHYVGRGDRVRFLEYGGRNRALRAGTGRRHYLMALEWLLGVQSGEGPHDPTEGIFRRHVLPTAALLIVLTPFLDRRSVAAVARLARSGRSVVAVDTLPSYARPAAGRPGPWSDAAFRMWRLERQNTLAQLLEHGVPTVTWAGAGSLDQVLRDVSRIAAAPR
ncbi:DUF58 domain-containing protein [Actinopolymorpha sp. B17G11]|uniref:DUF58 domain-containing protein n=1 Tax=Actinopolymorpha sp. B17G11 TaxID=3160861 RepID=UPI0032E3924C